MLATSVWIAALVTLSDTGTVSDASCDMTPSEQQWVEHSLSAWRYMADDRMHLVPGSAPTLVTYNDHCRFEAVASDKPTWTGRAHHGTIDLPDGGKMPFAVASFAGHDDKTGLTYFVMALPPVWSSAKVPIAGQDNGLTGVFLHEFSHVRHTSALDPAFEAATAIQPMPDDLDDDGVQNKFGNDPAYRAAVESEMKLLDQAAHEPDLGKAKALARSALAMMDARQNRWFVGDNAVWRNYDDIFLTMEGVGQWTAYAWLADSKGGQLEPGLAETTMRGGRRWWTQEEGLSLFMVIDRFLPDWPSRAFAVSPAMGIDLLRLAVGGRD